MSKVPDHIIATSLVQSHEHICCMADPHAALLWMLDAQKLLDRGGYQLLTPTPGTPTGESPKPARIRARYAGRCSGCDRAVCEGEMIAYDRNTRQIRCGECAR